MLERSDIVWALEQLAVRLGNAGHTVSISVVGGAAIVLEHNPDRGSTNDIDGWINATPATRAAVDSVITDISRERGWPGDWLNDQATTNGHPRGCPGQRLSRSVIPQGRDHHGRRTRSAVRDEAPGIARQT